MDAIETGIERRHRHSLKGKEESLVKTVISFDKGGVWSYLKPPKVDRSELISIAICTILSVIAISMSVVARKLTAPLLTSV